MSFFLTFSTVPLSERIGLPRFLLVPLAFPSNSIPPVTYAPLSRVDTWHVPSPSPRRPPQLLDNLWRRYNRLAALVVNILQVDKFSTSTASRPIAALNASLLVKRMTHDAAVLVVYI
jgi:hypothetical protein